MRLLCNLLPPSAMKNLRLNDAYSLRSDVVRRIRHCDEVGPRPIVPQPHREGDPLFGTGRKPNMLKPLMTDTLIPPVETAAVVPFPAEASRHPEQEPTARETELLLKIRDARDRGAFADLFGRFSPKIKGYLQRTGLNAEDAENVLQDIMIAVWNKARLFDPLRASARTWI